MSEKNHAGKQGQNQETGTLEDDRIEACITLAGKISMTPTHTHVVIGAEHPTIGYLYLDCIPESSVGYVDIYEVTDRLTYCEIRKAGWREHEPTCDGQAWEEWSILNHLSRIYWSDNDNIRSLCKKHGVEISALRDWSFKEAIWRDIPVLAEWNSAHTIYSASSLVEA
ncbi:hypothetical protein R9X49_22405 [Pectobacterium carotovorum]|uniref:hypothetical protein n=1 Tax=Pectobacterium carotovorum TaxID=554 RepID=UPI0029D87C4C|nr:hypothetical protein [Pectobacterium carotovorum]MDX6917853.1 hypothetical protein [Pectobacterium carotovorum]